VGPSRAWVAGAEGFEVPALNREQLAILEEAIEALQDTDLSFGLGSLPVSRWQRYSRRLTSAD
jgi:hypothetical protein